MYVQVGAGGQTLIKSFHCLLALLGKIGIWLDWLGSWAMRWNI